ncbi:MAG: ABC transporter ATP-binding protein [Bdellovibrionales bacterium]
MLKYNKHDKYTFEHTPNLDIPSSVIAYVRMVFKRNPRMWLVFLAFDILHALRYPVAFFLVGGVIDTLTSLESGAPVPQSVWNAAILIFVVLLIGELVHAIPHYIFFDWWKRARAQLRSDLFAYSLEHSFTYFQNHFAGSLARKVSEGIEKGLMIGEQVRFQILLPMTSMIFSAAVLFKVSPLFGGIICIFVVGILGPVFLKLHKIREKSRIYADACSDVSGQIVDSLTNIASVKSYAHEAREMQEHKVVSEVQMKAWHKMLRTFLMLDNYRRAVLVVFGSGMMFACVYAWQHGVITLGDMATIMGITFSFTGMAWYLSFGIIHLSESYGYLNDSLTTLIKPHQVKDKREAETLSVNDGQISFDGVFFDYGAEAKGKPVFDGLDITIPAGQRVGLIGSSGAGKSSFVNLIQRFFDVNDGAITIDGVDIRDVSQASLRHNIAVIPQDTALFHRTIMENIRYGRLDASDEEVIEAAKRAYALDFIQELPEGFETLVGERGVKLSGGQRQRIAIARAILKNAPILILDEATSALDSESEKLLQASLEGLMTGKTVIAIAHRLSTINTMDRLLVMDKGAIIEDGTHEMLLKDKGVYAKLWTMQSGGFLPK